MHPPPAPAEREQAIAAVAARQGGAIGRDQLLALGLTVKAIDSRVRSGRLHLIRRGVYAVGHPALGPTGHLHAALLDAGAGAVLSHRTAAAVWGLRPTNRRRVEVTVIRGGQRGNDTLQIHRTRRLDPRDVTGRDGLPVTTVARTLLDLADTVGHEALDRAVEQALILRRYDATALTDVLDRAAGRRGATRLRRAIAPLADTPPDVRSDLERDFLTFCAAHHLPTPATNVAIGPHTVDALWAAARLVVELDGRGTHHTPIAFEADRTRDRDLTLAGYRVIRVTNAHITQTPARLAGDLALLLA